MRQLDKSQVNIAQLVSLITEGICLRSSTNHGISLNVNLGHAAPANGAATAAAAAQPGGQGTQDYSAEWANYYRSLGKIEEAEAIEKQIATSKVRILKSIEMS